MSLLQIAWKSVRQRGLASLLTALSVALGVALMVGVLVLIGVLGRQFRQTGAGYDLVVGPKGSDLQLVLSTIYRIQPPIENLPYRYWKELQEDPGIASAVPLAIGDGTEDGNFPIVGTNAEYFTLPAARVGGKVVPFRVKGDFLKNQWDSVIGSEVARANGWTVGSEFKLVHSGQADHVHDEKFTVVGVLAPTGTPNDRTAFVNLTGFLSLGDHAIPPEEAIEREAKFFNEDPEDIRARNADKLSKLVLHGDHYDGVIPDLMKEVSAVLVTMKTDGADPNAGTMRAFLFRSKLKSGLQAQAANPVSVMQRLLDGLIGDAKTLLLVLAGLIVVVSGVGIFVSIYNSMSDRRREIGVMRALGARRGTVLGVILSESALLCVGGGIIGLLLGHGLVLLAAPILQARSGLLIDPFAFEPAELWLIPGLLIFGTLVGLLPGLTAYRTDVAAALEN